MSIFLSSKKKFVCYTKLKSQKRSLTLVLRSIEVKLKEERQPEKMGFLSLGASDFHSTKKNPKNQEKRYQNFLTNINQTAMLKCFLKNMRFMKLTFRMQVNIHFQKQNRSNLWEAIYTVSTGSGTCAFFFPVEDWVWEMEFTTCPPRFRALTNIITIWLDP